MNEIDWDKAPEGASHYVIGCGFFKLDLAGWFVCDDGEKVWRKTLYQSPDNFSWWGNAVERPSQPWSGEGLPPVGVVCEMERDTGRVLWHKVRILYIGSEHAIVVGEQGEQHFLLRGLKFRPIRTQEQIVAAEREVMISEIISIIRREGAFDIDDPEVTASAIALYRAGYRKT